MCLFTQRAGGEAPGAVSGYSGGTQQGGAVMDLDPVDAMGIGYGAGQIKGLVVGQVVAGAGSGVGRYGAVYCHDRRRGVDSCGQRCRAAAVAGYVVRRCDKTVVTGGKRAGGEAPGAVSGYRGGTQQGGAVMDLDTVYSMGVGYGAGQIKGLVAGQVIAGAGSGVGRYGAVYCHERRRGVDRCGQRCRAAAVAGYVVRRCDKTVVTGGKRAGGEAPGAVSGYRGGTQQGGAVMDLDTVYSMGVGYGAGQIKCLV